MEILGDEKKKQCLILLAVGLVLIFTVFGGWGQTISKQVRHYNQNRASMKEVWTREGMNEDALDVTISFFSKRFRAINGIFLEKALIFTLGLGASMLTHGMMWGSKNVNSILEIVCIVLSYGIPVVAIIIVPIVQDIIAMLATYSILGAFLWFAHNKVKKRELFLYTSFIAIPVLLLSVVFFSKGQVILLLGKNTEIEHYSKMSQGLKEAILKITGEAGISAHHVFVQQEDKYNAFAASGPRFKYVFMTTGIIEALTDEQLLSVIHHEVGHITRSHTSKIAAITILYLIGLATLAIFIHRKVAQHYNGLAALFAVECLISSFLVIHSFINNAFVSQRYEYEADRNAYSKEGHGPHLSEALKVLSLSNEGGKCFDYEIWTASLFTHPSVYKRICRQRSYNSNK